MQDHSPEKHHNQDKSFAAEENTAGQLLTRLRIWPTVAAQPLHGTTISQQHNHAGCEKAAHQRLYPLQAHRSLNDDQRVLSE